MRACACMLVRAYVKEREEEKERDLGMEVKRREDRTWKEERKGEDGSLFTVIINFNFSGLFYSSSPFTLCCLF